jgi:hypothetical protein
MPGIRCSGVLQHRLHAIESSRHDMNAAPVNVFLVDARMIEKALPD